MSGVNEKAAQHEALLREAKEALSKCSELFSEIRGDWTDPRNECRAGWAIVTEMNKKIDAALAESR